MDINLKFRTSPPGGRPIWLTVMTQSGRILELDWNDELISGDRSGNESFSAFGLYCPDDHDYVPDESDLDGATLIDANWRDADENPFTGTIEILSAEAENDDGEKFELSGTPLKLPKAIDYSKLDRGVRDAVEYLNRCGLRTKRSYGGQGLMRIEFHRSVCEMDLREFKGGQPMMGRFCILFEPDMKYALAYVAPSPDAVSRDLGQWKLKNPV